MTRHLVILVVIEGMPIDVNLVHPVSTVCGRQNGVHRNQRSTTLVAIFVLQARNVRIPTIGCDSTTQYFGNVLEQRVPSKNMLNMESSSSPERT